MDRKEEVDYLMGELARRELARKSFRRYLYYVHGPGWKRTRMSDYLADRMQEFVEADTGNAYDILLIQTPPQHGKSMTVTESFPSWYLGRYPHNRVIEASYNEDTAKRFGRKNLDKVEEFGSCIFGLTKGAVWTNTEFELGNGWGRMISRGIMSGITGNPANLMLIDDPIKNREEADSETYREKLWEEWQNTLKSRLSAGAKVVVIMTPWHEDDLSARLLRYENNTALLRLPIEAEEGDLLGRTPGEPLCPELGKDKKWLKQFKAGYTNDPRKGGLRAWQALYQCSPQVEGGNMIRRDWWRFYEKEPEYATELISVDAAFKSAEHNDYVAITVWGKRGEDYYLRHCLNRHLDFTGTLAAIRMLRRLYPRARTVLIEDKANGSAIINVLGREMFCVPVTPKGGKISRVNAISAAIESGHVFLPKDAPWLGEFLDQCAAFPSGKHDDMVDSTSQALAYLIFSSGHVEQPCEPEKKKMMEIQAREQEQFLSEDLYEVYGV